MAVSYVVNKTGSTFACRYRAVGPSGGGGIYTYSQQRGFLPFDLAPFGLSLGQVQSAVLILNCTTVVGGGATVRLRSAVDPNGFGATLDATNADWASTDTNVEDVLLVSSTGFHQWNVNPANLNFSGVTYLSLFNEDEGAGSPFQTASVFNSREIAVAANRPVLRLTLRTGQLIFVQVT